MEIGILALCIAGMLSLVSMLSVPHEEPHKTVSVNTSINYSGIYSPEEL